MSHYSGLARTFSVLLCFHLFSGNNAAVARFSDDRCEADGVCPSDPLTFTCVINGALNLRVQLPNGHDETVSLGNGPEDVDLPDGFTAVTLAITEIDSSTRDFLLTLSIAEASLLAGGEIRCDDTIPGNGNVVMAGCPILASPTASNLRQLLSSNTPTTATITWDSVDNAVSYTVRSASLQSPATGIEEESYTLELETDYTVTVTATNECGVESPPSEDITVRIDIQAPAAPILPQTAAVTQPDCRQTFQSQISQLLATKQSCVSAALYDCCQILQLLSKAPTGVYSVQDFTRVESPFSVPVVPTTLTARCDMTTDGGGWMVIQRRLPNGIVNFTRCWSDYENGFGDLDGEFWYGLKNIHQLTTRDDVELRVDMVKADDGTKLTWTYQTFRVADASDNYRLTIGEKQESGYDFMAYHNGSQFSTYDQDNDKENINCAFIDQGGWWYNSCFTANLNGPHTLPSTPGVDQTYALLLLHNSHEDQRLSSVEIKIRVKHCIPSTC